MTIENLINEADKNGYVIHFDISENLVRLIQELEELCDRDRGFYHTHDFGIMTDTNGKEWLELIKLED